MYNFFNAAKLQKNIFYFYFNFFNIKITFIKKL